MLLTGPALLVYNFWAENGFPIRELVVLGTDGSIAGYIKLCLSTPHWQVVSKSMREDIWAVVKTFQKMRLDVIRTDREHS